jgi:hypothetical protein
MEHESGLLSLMNDNTQEGAFAMPDHASGWRDVFNTTCKVTNRIRPVMNCLVLSCFGQRAGRDGAVGRRDQSAYRIDLSRSLDRRWNSATPSEAVSPGVVFSFFVLA